MSSFLKHREEPLDALRGIAALIVVIAHTTIAGLYKVEPFWGYLKWSPLKIFWSGHQAVILFFVLSGFALVRMWQGIGGGRYDAYFIARVVRLFPPYIASVLLALAAYYYASSVVEWDKGWMGVPKPDFSFQLLANHALMVGQFNTSEVNPPIWSIVHEMRISIAFPLIFFLVSRFGGWAVACFYAMSTCIGWAMLGNVQLSGVQGDLIQTLHYSTFFAVGAFIALQQERLCRFFKEIEGSKRTALWLASLILYAYPFDNPWNLGYRDFGDLITGVGSGLIVCLALTMKSNIFVRFGGYLGRISFSLYLNHILALNLSLLFLFRSYGAPAVWMATIVGAVLLSSVMHKIVEVPSISASRYLRRKVLFGKPDSVL
ncbi:acyltransferase family protein [Pseudomonas sp. BF-B-26]|uniref:acyltransferase family protein n=1 Tax=Pseudomonas sp. BF-B-26 TaxID=2832400 RepID=UPI001CBB96EB|nr:acyltransferase [Pseudomonas sp. BF-B-26]